MLSDDSEDLDMTSFFLFSSMLQKDCTTNTDNQFQSMLPLLLMSDDSSNATSSNLMLMMMMQTMGSSPLGKWQRFSET